MYALLCTPKVGSLVTVRGSKRREEKKGGNTGLYNELGVSHDINCVICVFKKLPPQDILY